MKTCMKCKYLKGNLNGALRCDKRVFVIVDEIFDDPKNAYNECVLQAQDCKKFEEFKEEKKCLT